MNKLILTGILFLSLMSCKENSINQKQKLDTKAGMGQLVNKEDSSLSYEEIMKFHNSPDRESLVDSGRVALRDFGLLINSKQYEAALKLYDQNEANILIALKTTTAIYNFHTEYIFPCIDIVKILSEANLRIIEILESDLMMADIVIEFSNWQTIPEHYENLISTLGQYYIEEKKYNDAIGIVDKTQEYLKQVSVPESIGFGLINYNKGFVYYLMEDYPSAVKYLKESKVILEKCKMEDCKTYKDCLSLLNEIETYTK